MPATRKKPYSNQIAKNSEIYTRYKAMALDYAEQGYCNFAEVYAKHHPKVNADSANASASRLLASATFQQVLDDVWLQASLKKMDTVKEVHNVLRKEMTTAPKSSDRISAASWLGKTKAMFIDKSDDKLNITDDSITEEVARLTGCKRRIVKT